MAELRRRCELCDEEATVYCSSDSAFLCTECDDKVHRANFLVARHVRVHVCSQCRTLAGKSFSGVGVSSPGTAKATCEKCSLLVGNGDDNDDCLSSSSSCVSSTGEPEEVVLPASSASSERKRIDNGDTKAEGILVNWCMRMGVVGDQVDSTSVVKTTVDVLNRSVGKMTVLPFRVLLAAAFWVAMRVCCNRCEMGRLEKVSGVPSKLILATESRLARVIKRSKRAREDHEEGWAEC